LASGLAIDLLLFILSLILFAGYDYENNSAFVLFLADIIASLMLTLYWLPETWLLDDSSYDEHIAMQK